MGQSKIFALDKSAPRAIVVRKLITPVEGAPGILTVPVKVGLTSGAQLPIWV